MKDYSVQLSRLKESVIDEINRLFSGSSRRLPDGDLIFATPDGNAEVRQITDYILFCLVLKLDNGQSMELHELQADDLIALYRYLMTNTMIHEVEGDIGERQVPELDAKVLTMTFPQTGQTEVYKADLYASPNECDMIVFSGSCAPAGAHFMHKLLIRL